MTHLITFPDRSYLRTGACDGCPANPGACCQFLVLPERPPTADEWKWLQLHDGAADLYRAGVRGKQAIPCSALIGGVCSLYGTDARPDLCNRYPEMPEQLIEGCAYTLMEV